MTINPKNSVYIRRCHICGELTENEGYDHPQKCRHCGKAFARFHYFDDLKVPSQTDFDLRAPLAPGEYLPLRGLTVYWDNESHTSRY